MEQLEQLNQLKKKKLGMEFQMMSQLWELELKAKK